MRDRIRSWLPDVSKQTCEYCSKSFIRQGAYHDHLQEVHSDELGAIERRRLQRSDQDREYSLGPVVLAGVFALPVIVLAYLLTTGAAPGGTAGSTHNHGTITVTIDGQQIDFSRSKYQLQDQRFHFEGGEGDRWHVHSTGVTLGYAMDTLGINVTRSSVTYQGTTYRDGDPAWRVSVTVNGRHVVPSEYVLKDGDTVRIIVERT